MKFELLDIIYRSRYLEKRYMSCFELSEDMTKVFELQDIIVDGEMQFNKQYNSYLD